MSLTTRILPYEEWPRLTGTLLEDVWPNLNPHTSCIVAIEDGDRIVGCVAMLSVWHVEGVWVAEARRGKASVARRLVRAIRQWAAAWGVTEFVTMSRSEASSRMIRRFGQVTDLTCEHFAVKL